MIAPNVNITAQNCLTVDNILNGDSVAVRLNNPREFIKWANQCYPESESIDSKEQFEIQYRIVKARVALSEYDLAVKILDSLSRGPNLLTDQKALIQAKLARIYSLSLLFDFSERSYKKALSLVDLMESQSDKVVVLLDLGEMRRRVSYGAWEGHLLLRKALKIALENDLDDHLLAKIHSRLAATFESPEVSNRISGNTTDSILLHAEMAIHYAHSPRAENTLASAHNLIGANHRYFGRDKEALDHFKTASKIWSENYYFRDLANGLFNQISIYSENEELRKEKQLLDSVLRLVKTSTWDYEKHQAVWLRCNYYKKAHSLDTALFWTERLIFIHDSLNNHASSRKTELTRVIYETEKYYRSNKLKQAKLKREKEAGQRMFSFIIGLVIACLILVVFLFRMRLLNQKVARQSSEIKDVNLALNQSLEEKEVLLQELNHRVKNNLSMLAGLLELQRSKSQDKGIKDALAETIERIQTLSTIHKSSYQFEDLRSIELKNIFNELIEAHVHLSTSVEMSQITCEIENLNLDISRLIPLSLICTELITNALKYGVKSNGRMAIKLMKLGSEVSLEVRDTGPGIDASFDSVVSDSMGIYLIELLAKQLNGSFSWRKESDWFISTVKFPL